MKILFVTLLLTLFFSLLASATLQVATTTTDLAALTKKVGEDRISVFSIGKGTQDPHQIEAKPSFMVKLRNTDLVISQGLELESAWLAPLMTGSRNPKLSAKDSVFELGPRLNPIEIPHGKISRAEGDVHPGGNPHFQLDPIRLGQAAVLISEKLGSLDPSNKDFYTKNAEQFQKQMTEKTKDWKNLIQKSGVTEIVTYHKTFSYFCERFEIKCQVQLEPKPGIPPTTSHLLSVVEQMKKRKIRLVLIENLYEDSVGDKIKTEIPTALVKRVPVMVEGETSIHSNEDLIAHLVKAIQEAKP